jgi:hypothetical protein
MTHYPLMIPGTTLANALVAYGCGVAWLCLVFALCVGCRYLFRCLDRLKMRVEDGWKKEAQR